MVDVSGQCGTTHQRLAIYLNVIADASNKTGTDAIYLKRSTIAKLMGCSIKTVERCRRAAIELGYHTAGYQARWIDTSKPSANPWCASSATVLLTMPDKASLPISPEGQLAQERIAIRKAAKQRKALEAKQQRDAEHQAEMQARIAAAPDKLPSNAGRLTQGMIDEIAAGRARVARAQAKGYIDTR